MHKYRGEIEARQLAYGSLVEQVVELRETHTRAHKEIGEMHLLYTLKSE
jgi:hypothetical protein